jgi:hypothetical protein
VTIYRRNTLKLAGISPHVLQCPCTPGPCTRIPRHFTRSVMKLCARVVFFLNIQHTVNIEQSQQPFYRNRKRKEQVSME